MSEYKINVFQLDILRKIRKHSDGVSKEKLVKFYPKKSGIETALAELVKEGYLERSESDDDKVRRVMQLPVEEYTGNYLLTDKAYAYFTNKRFELPFRFWNWFAGVITGVISTLLVQYLSK